MISKIKRSWPWLLVAAVAFTMAVGSFALVNHAYGDDKVTRPVYVNLPTVDNTDHLTVEPFEDWPFFHDLDEAADMTTVWGYADYQRNLLGFRISISYGEEIYQSCVVMEINDVRYAKTEDPHNKMEFYQQVLIDCPSIEAWFEIELKNTKENWNE